MSHPGYETAPSTFKAISWHIFAKLLNITANKETLIAFTGSKPHSSTICTVVLALYIIKLCTCPVAAIGICQSWEKSRNRHLRFLLCVTYCGDTSMTQWPLLKTATSLSTLKRHGDTPTHTHMHKGPSHRDLTLWVRDSFWPCSSSCDHLVALADITSGSFSLSLSPYACFFGVGLSSLFVKRFVTMYL